MTGDEFARFDAIALADQIRRKTVSASEVLEASIVSIDKLNPRLNAVICKLYEQARDQLSTLERIPEGARETGAIQPVEDRSG
jgi:amidase